MKTRLANKFDLPQVIRLLKQFQKETPIDAMSAIYDEQHINKCFQHILMGAGVAIVADAPNGDTVGIIIGVVAPNLWDPQLLWLKELAFFVDHEYRNTSAAYRLITHYNQIAEEMTNDGRIFCYTLTKMVNSPDLKFDRFGYRKIEETWVKGA